MNTQRRIRTNPIKRLRKDILAEGSPCEGIRRESRYLMRPCTGAALASRYSSVGVSRKPWFWPLRVPDPTICPQMLMSVTVLSTQPDPGRIRLLRSRMPLWQVHINGRPVTTPLPGGVHPIECVARDADYLAKEVYFVGLA